MDVENRMRSPTAELSAHECEARLNRIEEAITQENLSPSSSEVFVLREHIELVRGQIQRFTQVKQNTGASI